MIEILQWIEVNHMILVEILLLITGIGVIISKWTKTEKDDKLFQRLGELLRSLIPGVKTKR